MCARAFVSFFFSLHHKQEAYIKLLRMFLHTIGLAYVFTQVSKSVFQSLKSVRPAHVYAGGRAGVDNEIKVWLTMRI